MFTDIGIDRQFSGIVTFLVRSQIFPGDLGITSCPPLITYKCIIYLRIEEKRTNFQSPRCPPMSPVATSRLLVQGWKAAEKTRSFTTLATVSSVILMIFRAEPYLREKIDFFCCLYEPCVE